MFPALAQNLEICLVPESQRMVTILWPGPSFSAVLTAAMPFESVSLASIGEVAPTIDGTATSHEYPVFLRKPSSHR